jgi:hypothetical protein
LRRAIGVTPTRYYGGTIFIAVGVRRGFRRAITASARGRIRSRGRAFTAANPSAAVRDPVKYWHLVSGGRKASIAGAGGSDKRVLAGPGKIFGTYAAPVAANPFVDRAFAACQASVIAMITSEAPGLIEAEAGKMGG